MARGPHHHHRLARHAEARRAAAASESALVATMAAHAQTRRLLDDALAAGDRLMAEGFERQLETLAARVTAERAALDAGRAAAAGARADALAGGAGFDLLSGQDPLLLLPVRLEARFAWRKGTVLTFTADPALEEVLLVRVFPDEIHADTHDPRITPDEAEAMVVFLKAVTSTQDLPPIRAAWQELAARVGPMRAGWIGELAISRRRPTIRPPRFTRPAVARLLPDRWIAVAELEDGSRHTATSDPVVEPLELPPSDAALAWTTDFAVALKVGMAVIIPNLPAGTVRVRKLRVVGARGTSTPAETSAELEELLRAHQFTRGLELLAPGTPTNSLPGARAAYSSRPTGAEVADWNLRRYLVGGVASPLCQPGDDSDGTTLASLLGVAASTFAYVPRADATNRRDGADVRALLAAATERTLVRQFAGALAPATVREVLEYGAQRVSALGPVAALRVGPQPYGILPVLRRDASRMRAGSAAQRYLPALERLRAHWEAAVPLVKRVGKPGADPAQTLIRILQQDGVARRVAFRPFIGPQVGGQAAPALTAAERADLAARRSGAEQLLGALLGVPISPATPLVQALHLSMAPSLRAPLVLAAGPPPPPGSPQLPAGYLELAASMRVDWLYRHEYPNGERPHPLLFAIARLAILERADARARELFVSQGADPRRWDDDDLPAQVVDYYASMQRRLEAADPLDPLASPGSLATQLSEQGREAPALALLRQSLRDLGARPAELLEEHLRASLCLFSSRLDAWYTALATEEMEAIRQDPARASGLHVGAYGVLDDIEQQPRRPATTPGVYTNPMNGGYLHAPSVNQGAAAAVLRSVHLAHSAAGHGEAFSVDLSSARVRSGLHLAEGVRAGQPLAALLGYQIERDLQAERIPQLIAPLRGVAPLLANRLTPSGLPAESVAATNVVDGLTLLADAGYDGQQHATVGKLVDRHRSALARLLSASATESALQRALTAAENAIDAVADLVLAESVYQAVQGNHARGGAALDSLSGAPVPPADLSILKTPRSGIGVTHRLMVVLGDGGGGSTGWRDTPRALGEPRLEGWARQVLPAPAQIVLRVRDNARKLDEVLASADAVAQTVAGSTSWSLRVAQLGGPAGERWAALPLAAGGALPGGRVSLVLVTAGPAMPAAAIAGLLVDEWVEVVPAAAETTSITFHHDAPTAAPPQVWLVGVPYPTQEGWSSTDVLEIVEEALGLGRIRLADTDALPELGQLLPALVTVESPAAELAGLDVEALTQPGTA